MGKEYKEIFTKSSKPKKEKSTHLLEAISAQPKEPKVQYT